MYNNIIRTVILLCLTTLWSCQGGHQQTVLQQPALDSMAMWYKKMQPDSMEAISNRLHEYIRQHQGDNSNAMRRLQGEWLLSRAVRFMTFYGRPDSALVCIRQAQKEIENLEGLNKQKIMAKANEADCYRQLGKLDDSADCYLQALEMADATGQTDSAKIVLMLGISTVYTFMGDYQSSRIWWQRTGELVDEMETTDQFIYYNNVGNDHYFQKHYPEARDYFRKAIQTVEGNENKLWDYYLAKGNLGEIYVCLGKADSAQVLIAQSDSFFRKVNFPPVLYYLETERIELATLEGRLQDALQMVDNSEFKDVVIPSAKVLRLKAEEQLMQKLGRSERAYKAHLMYHALNDSIQDENIRMQMNTKLMQYEHDKRLLEKENIINKERMNGRLGWVLLATALLAIALLVALIWIWRRRQQVKDLMVRQQIIGMRMENIRNRISPHFIYNALSHEMLAQAEGRKVDLDTLTQLLRRESDQADMLETTLSKELAFVEYYIVVEGRQMPQELLYDKEIAGDVDTETVKLPAMTVQIFVENAIKHGLQRKGGHIVIRASRQQQATLIEVIDNGKGLSPTYQEHTGLKVVNQTIQMLNEHNLQKISYGIEDMKPGCRSWLLIPDNYNYKITMI